MNSLFAFGIFCALGFAFAGGAGTAQDVTALARQTEEANQALVHGDIDRYIALTHHGKDYLLMNPFGGTTKGFGDSPERREGMKKFFKNGALEQEVLATWESGDLAVLVTIERVAHVEIGGVSAQDWGLRVTQVFRRDGKDWQLVHRHADPLVGKITVPQAAELARGSAR